MRRVGVTGGRAYSDRTTVRRVMERLRKKDPETVIVNGGAYGADRLCAEEAARLGMTIETHLANWERGGKSEGPRRNQRMVDSGLDLLVAFPGGRGTADMMRRARAAGVWVEVVLYEEEPRS